MNELRPKRRGTEGYTKRLYFGPRARRATRQITTGPPSCPCFLMRAGAVQPLGRTAQSAPRSASQASPASRSPVISQAQRRIGVHRFVARPARVPRAAEEGQPRMTRITRIKARSSAPIRVIRAIRVSSAICHLRRRHSTTPAQVVERTLGTKEDVDHPSGSALGPRRPADRSRRLRRCRARSWKSASAVPR